MTIAVSSPVCTALPRSDTPRSNPGSTGSVPRSTSSTQTATPILRFPRTNRTTWYRLTCLAHYRGEHGDALQEFLQHATYEAGPRGLLRDVPRLINTYKAARNISERSAWRALKAACQRGWIRCTQHAAPGYPARYELQVPVGLVVNGLPDDLAQELALWDEDALPEADHADTYVGHLSQAPVAPVCLIPPADPFPEPRTAPDATPDSSSDVECQTSPYTATAFYPLLDETFTIPGAISESSPEPAWRPSRRRQKPTPQELTDARQVLAQCERWWRHQRGGSGVLSARELASLVEPAALALRRATRTEVIEAATFQTRSARSLADLVGFRLWRIIKTRTEWDQTRPAELPDGWHHDDQGARHAGVLNHQHQVLHPWNTSRIGPIRDRIRQDRQRAVEAGRAAEQTAPARQWQREDEFEFLAARAEIEDVDQPSPMEIYRERAWRSRQERWEREWNR